MPQMQLPNKPTMRVDEVARYFCRTDKTIRRWITEGRLKAYKLHTGGLVVPTTEVPNVYRPSSDCYQED